MSSFPSQPERRLQARRTWIKRSAVALPLLCLLIFGTIIGSRLLGSGTGADAASLVPLKGNVPGLVKTSTLVGPTDPNQNLSLSIGLKLRNADSLKNYVDNASRPASDNKAHLTASEIAAGYAPLASSQQAVIDYLKSYGFHVTMTLSQHLVIGVQGTVSEANNAFHFKINNYKSTNGNTFYAPDNDPSLPANLAGFVLNIAGLDNLRHFSHPPVKSSANNQIVLTTTGSTSNCPGLNTLAYLPSQLANAYNLTGLYNAGFRGEGQTVGLIEFDDYKASDIQTYTSCFGGQNAPIKRVLVDGGAGAPGIGAIEVELDMEMILSVAPNLAALDVYEAPNNDAGAIDMYSQIINNNAISVISTSWGSCENSQFTQAIYQEENNLFTLAAAQGQTVFAASGDTGTNDCRIPLGRTNPAPYLAVDDPASQPYVTGVGGTSLNLSGDNYISESAWNNGSDGTYVHAGGGGWSSIWPRPYWQQGPGVGTIGGREVPDVSLNADPENGKAYLVYCSVANTGCSGTGGWYAIGGTSAAAPVWAAFLALSNEKTIRDGGFYLGWINPSLYQIDSNANGTSYSNDFHDITVGNNDGLNDGQATYAATPNYDMASGLGSFQALNLANDLEKLGTALHASRQSPASKVWYFAEGSVGGTFTEYLTILNPDTTQTAHVAVQYLFENQPAVTKNYTVAPSTRFTTTVNDDLGIAASAPQQAISAIVTSDVGIVAERPMYFNRPNDLGSSGTDVLGATNASQTTFYFADGDSSQTANDSSQEFIAILNPNPASAVVTATFYSNGAAVDTQVVNIASLHRGTIVTSYHGHAAIQLTSSIGVVVERPTYFKVNVPTAGGMTSGAASTVAATAPNAFWYFAEGHTADDFQENLVLANFGTTAAVATTITMEYTNGTTQNAFVNINPQSQVVFDVNNAYLHPTCGTSCKPTADVSIEVVTSASVVAERVMYFHYKGKISGGTDVIGSTVSGNYLSIFAEGYTNNGFDEWLTLQNSWTSSALVAVTLFFDGTIIQKEFTLPAHSRTTLNINDIVVPVASAYPDPNGGDGYNVSIHVQIFGGSLVAERPMYFTFMGASPGGTDIIGYNGD